MRTFPIPEVPDSILWHTADSYPALPWRVWSWGVVATAGHYQTIEIYDTRDDAIAAAQADAANGGPLAAAARAMPDPNAVPAPEPEPEDPPAPPAPEPDPRPEPDPVPAPEEDPTP